MSITMPVPMTFTVPSRSIPLGRRLSMNFPLSFTTVWPALLPP